MRRAVGPLLAVTVALVLADSAVVTLALPDILRHLDTTVGQVAWVLISSISCSGCAPCQRP